MRFGKVATLVAGVAVAGAALLALLTATGRSSSAGSAAPAVAAPVRAYGPQYVTAHVYVEHGKLADFVHSWEATFGGTNTPSSPVDITPTPSTMIGSIIKSPVGVISAYDYQTPVPFPFGLEQVGWAVHDVNAAVESGRRMGLTTPVAPWTGPSGREAVVRFPGEFTTQLWEQFDMSGYPQLASQPEGRIYVSDDTVAAFLTSYLEFTGGRVVSDVRDADGGEIGAPGSKYHRIRLTSPFGNVVVSAGDGHWNYPFGRDVAGYTVSDVDATVAKAEANGATLLSPPYAGRDRKSAQLKFPGGYIAEVHDHPLA